MSSCILSLLSPVLRNMVCGNFKERIIKEISLDDVEGERLCKLLELACGKDQVVVKDIEELLHLAELADRLQMEEVKSEIEDKLLMVLKAENCLELIGRSETNGLQRLQDECYKTLRDEFDDISLKEGFLLLSEEIIRNLLEEDELGVSDEENVFKALMRWISCNADRTRMKGLLGKVRYGVMSDEYLAGNLLLAFPMDRVLKELVGEAMAKKKLAGGEEMWDGVERLCDKWTVARKIKGRIIGAEVLKNPGYLAIDAQGRIVVSDEMAHVIIVFNINGSVARRIGSRGTAAGQFLRPLGVAVGGQGHIIVSDYGNHRIQVLNADGSVVRCFGSQGSAVGQLRYPCGVAVDKEGHIVVADAHNHRIQVFDGDGCVVRHLSSAGIEVGQVEYPTDVKVDAEGRIVVTELGNQRVQVFNRDWSVALCFGSEGDGVGQLKHPWGVALDSAGRFVVSDTDNHRVQIFNADGSAARIIGSMGNGVGELIDPCGVVVDGSGRIFVVERSDNHRIQVL